MKIATEIKQTPVFLMKFGAGYHCSTKHCLWSVKAAAPGNLILPFSESGVEAGGARRDGEARFEFSDLLLSESGG